MESLSETVPVILTAARGYMQPVVGILMAQIGTSRSETELVLFTSVSTAISVFVVLLVSKLLFRTPAKRADACCVTEFVQKRRATNLGPSIPASPEAAPAQHSHAIDTFLHEVHHQLAAIQREIQTLKQEREVIDHELIETSTQILQTIGATMLPLEDEPILDSPKIVKPVPSRPVVERPVIDVTPAKQPQPVQVPQMRQPVMASAPSSGSPISRPIEQPSQPIPQVPVVKPSVVPPAAMPKVAPSIPAVNAPVAAPAQPALTPQVRAPVSAPVTAPIAAPVPVRAPVNVASAGDSSPRQVASKPAVPQPVAAAQAQEPPSAPALPAQIPKAAPAQAAPKMSALAMARMKREQEQTEAKSAAPPPAASNPFGKPKPGPFGAVPLVK